MKNFFALFKSAFQVQKSAGHSLIPALWNPHMYAQMILGTYLLAYSDDSFHHVFGVGGHEIKRFLDIVKLELVV